MNWLLCLLHAIHWCNPILWLAFARMRADREAACDAQVIAATATDCRADYGHALLKLEGTLAGPSLGLGFIGIFERAAGVRSRIRAIAACRPAHRAWGVCGALLIGVVALIGATRAQERTAHRQANAEVNAKLEKIILPSLELQNVTFREALEYLAKRSEELDVAEPNLSKRGVKIVLNLDAPPDPEFDSTEGVPPPNPTEARVTVKLSDVPLGVAFKHVTELVQASE